MSKPSVLEIVKKGVESGVKLMGDDFIGFKFIGEESDFWNGLLLKCYELGEDIGSVLNMEYLDKEGIEYLEYDSAKFN